MSISVGNHGGDRTKLSVPSVYIRMRDIRFNISLYIIIPFIFAGIALLSTIVSYQITHHRLERGMDPYWPVALWAGIIVLTTSICGLIVAKMLLKPMEEFVAKTEKLGVLQNITQKDPTSPRPDDMDRFKRVFNHVTELLSQVESKRLFPDVIGQSKAMRGVLNQVIKVAPTDSTVLILGETGTGKEVIANSIYQHSSRQGKPFVAINCAAIPEGLLESELFGHEKGAFTGAGSRKLGKFEIANGGTVFLDEIGDMPLETQAKVLRVLQDSRFERVGGNRSIKVDVRFIAATNKDLAKMVESEAFRQDLFFRLHVFPIYLPPLRERSEDIPEFVERFLKHLGKDGLAVSRESMKFLRSYSWPGNVRELQNAVESASVLAQDEIQPPHLPPGIIRDTNLMPDSNSMRQDFFDNRGEESEDWTLDHHLKEFEKNIIVETLSRTGGIQVKAAEILGISTRSLGHRVKKHDIDVGAIKRGIK